MNAIGLIDDLKIGGIFTKIEGRYGAVSEITDVIHKLRDAIDGQPFSSQYNENLNYSVTINEQIRKSTKNLFGFSSVKDI